MMIVLRNILDLSWEIICLHLYTNDRNFRIYQTVPVNRHASSPTPKRAMKAMKNLLNLALLSVLVPLMAMSVVAQDRKEPRIALTIGEVHDELLVTVNNGRTQRALLTILKDSKPTHLLVAHSNDGLIGLVGYPQLTGSNRNAPLIRARHLLVSDYIALVQFECPRDVQNECQDTYRTSDALVADVQVLLDMVKKKIAYTKVSHIGHLGGAVSAVVLSSKGGVDSTIILAPPDPYQDKARFTGAQVFRDTPLNALKSRVIVFAHEDTECTIANFENAKRLAKGVSFVAVKGYSAIDQATRAGCANLGRHGFIGREREIGFATLNFIEGVSTPPESIK
jgi:hypothetical protein